MIWADTIQTSSQTATISLIPSLSSKSVQNWKGKSLAGAGDKLKLTLLHNAKLWCVLLCTKARHSAEFTLPFHWEHFGVNTSLKASVGVVSTAQDDFWGAKPFCRATRQKESSPIMLHVCLPSYGCPNTHCVQLKSFCSGPNQQENKYLLRIFNQKTMVCRLTWHEPKASSPDSSFQWKSWRSEGSLGQSETCSFNANWAVTSVKSEPLYTFAKTEKPPEKKHLRFTY